MKKLFFLFVFVFLSGSCSLKDDSENYHLEALAVFEVDMPAYFEFGDTNQITIRYKRPSNCHFFDGFILEKNDNTRTVAIQSYVLEKNTCEDLVDVVEEVVMDFNVVNSSTYIFKFWQGKDQNGDDIFLEFEVPVQ
jgi:hypothetical protein